MEEEKADALEVAAQENEERKAQKAEAKVSLFLFLSQILIFGISANFRAFINPMVKVEYSHEISKIKQNLQ